MKILHLADLHIGKRIFGYSLIEDQRYFLNNTVQLVRDRNIDAVVIAGDIYDVATPGSEATSLLSKFLQDLVDIHVPVLIIPGNHDMASRFDYGKELFRLHGVYFATEISESSEPIEINGVNFYLLPFVNHHDVNRYLSTEYKNYDDAVKGFVDELELDERKANVLIAHQLVMPSHGDLKKDGSEDLVIGGVGNIRASAFVRFDYVALGHIHNAQDVAANARYCGSPLAFSSDESSTDKTYTIVNIEGKNVSYETVPIVPLRKVSVLTGTFEEILRHPECADNYVYARITDNETVENGMKKLKAVYPYCLNMKYERDDNESHLDMSRNIDVEDIDIEELFSEFYEKQNSEELTEEQKKIMEDLFNRIGGIE